MCIDWAHYKHVSYKSVCLLLFLAVTYNNDIRLKRVPCFQVVLNDLEAKKLCLIITKHENYHIINGVANRSTLHYSTTNSTLSYLHVSMDAISETHTCHILEKLKQSHNVSSLYPILSIGRSILLPLQIKNRAYWIIPMTRSSRESVCYNTLSFIFSIE